MNISLKDGFNYIPDFNGNKDVKKKDQFSVDFKFLRGLDIAEIIGPDGKANNLKEWLIICDKVNNFQINGKEVTPEDIATQPGLYELFVELKLAFKMETVINKKKL